MKTLVVLRALSVLLVVLGLALPWFRGSDHPARAAPAAISEPPALGAAAIGALAAGAPTTLAPCCAGVCTCRIGCCAADPFEGDGGCCLDHVLAVAPWVPCCAGTSSASGACGGSR